MIYIQKMPPYILASFASHVIGYTLTRLTVCFLT
jgi:hypothetical protein